jgi:hypothetical protein
MASDLATLSPTPRGGACPHPRRWHRSRTLFSPSRRPIQGPLGRGAPAAACTRKTGGDHGVWYASLSRCGKLGRARLRSRRRQNGVPRPPPLIGRLARPRAYHADYVRDGAMQARELTETLAILGTVGVDVLKRIGESRGAAEESPSGFGGQVMEAGSTYRDNRDFGSRQLPIFVPTASVSASSCDESSPRRDRRRDARVDEVREL